MQEILPRLCDFHNDDIFRDDTKIIFFDSIRLSLQTIYPKLKNHDFSTFRVPIDKDWQQTMLKLRTIVNMEIRKNFIGRSKASSVLNTDKFSDKFIKMAAIVVYIVNKIVKNFTLLYVYYIYKTLCRFNGMWNCKVLRAEIRRRLANVHDTISLRMSSI